MVRKRRAFEARLYDQMTASGAPDLVVVALPEQVLTAMSLFAAVVDLILAPQLLSWESGKYVSCEKT